MPPHPEVNDKYEVAKGIMYDKHSLYKTLRIIAENSFSIDEHKGVIEHDSCCFCCKGTIGIEIILENNGGNGYQIFRTELMCEDVYEYDYKKGKEVLKGKSYCESHTRLNNKKPSVIEKLYYKNYDYQVLFDMERDM